MAGQWVPGEGIGFYEWTHTGGQVIGNRDFFGGGANRERGARPADMPLVIQDCPQVFLTSRPPGNVIEPHFHEMPQYQVFFEGHGRVGKHPVRPITVHYTDAFTPYGPIVASEDEGLAFYTLRGKTSNSGAHYMPQSRHRLARKAGRAFTVEAEVRDRAAMTAVQQLIRRCDDGVEATLLSLAAGDHVRPDDSGPNGGRFLLVVSGALVQDGQEFARRSCIFVAPGEGAPELAASSRGAQVLALQFAPYAGRASAGRVSSWVSAGRVSAGRRC